MTLQGLRNKKGEIEKKINILESYKSSITSKKNIYKDYQEFDKKRKSEYKSSGWKGRRGEDFSAALQDLCDTENTYYKNAYSNALNLISTTISKLKSDYSQVKYAIAVAESKQ